MSSSSSDNEEEDAKLSKRQLKSMLKKRKSSGRRPASSGKRHSSSAHSKSTTAASTEPEAAINNGDEDADESEPLNKESVVDLVEACLEKLLTSRRLLRSLLVLQDKQERMKAGDLSLPEIHELAKDESNGANGGVGDSANAHRDGDDEEDDRGFAPMDFVFELQKLKGDLINNIRKNHLLESDRSKLDKRIELLIKNRGNLQSIVSASRGLKSQRKKRAKEQAANEQERMQYVLGDPQRKRNYQHLFYLLQTDPRILGSLVFRMQKKEMVEFLDTVILALFGDAFSPRDEYLLLELFKHSLNYELGSMKKLKDFLTSTESVVPRMVTSYNKRKPGLEYLRTTLGPLVRDLVTDAALSLELRPSQVYRELITAEEMASGTKSERPRNLGDAEAFKTDKDTARAVKSHIKKAIAVCKRVVAAMTGAVDALPYGTRWICRMLRDLANENFAADTGADDADEVFKCTGYFLYSRFINLALTSPDEFDLLNGSLEDDDGDGEDDGEGNENAGHQQQQEQTSQRTGGGSGGRFSSKPITDLSPTARKNLATLARILQNLFLLTTFDASKQPWIVPVNEWIKQTMPSIRQFYEKLVDVSPPDEALQLNRYMELTQRTKPVIVISPQEIVAVHRHVRDHLDALVAATVDEKELNLGGDDPLTIVMEELGEVPESAPDADDDMEQVHLVLENRFRDAAADHLAAERDRYAELKELLVSALRVIPLDASAGDGTAPVTLPGILAAGRRHAKHRKLKKLTDQLKKIQDSLRDLDGVSTLSKDDGYAAFLKELALDLANRAAVLAEQRKELARLQRTLDSLLDQQRYLEAQIDDYNKYLQTCREMQSVAQQRKKKKGLIKYFSGRDGGGAGPSSMAAATAAAATAASSGAAAEPVTKKFTYQQLVKKGVLVSSEIPKMLHSKTTFEISTTSEPGVFHVVGRVGPKSEEMDVEIDDLLERQEMGIGELELEQVSLDCNMTLSLINNEF